MEIIVKNTNGVSAVVARGLNAKGKVVETKAQLNPSKEICDVIADKILNAKEGTSFGIYTRLTNDAILIRNILAKLNKGFEPSDMPQQLTAKWGEKAKSYITEAQKESWINLAEAMQTAMDENKDAFKFQNIRARFELIADQFYPVDGVDMDELVGKKVTIANAVDADENKIAVIDGMEDLGYFANNAFGVGREFELKVSNFGGHKTYYVDRFVDPHADKAWNELSDADKRDYRNINGVIECAFKKIEDVLPSGMNAVADEAEDDEMLG